VGNSHSLWYEWNSSFTFFMTDCANAQLFLRVRKPLNTAGAFQISHIKTYLIEIFFVAFLLTLFPEFLTHFYML